MFSCGVYEIFKYWSLRTTASVLSPEVSVFVSYTSGLNCYMVLYHNSQFRLPIVPSLLLIMLCVCVYALPPAVSSGCTTSVTYVRSSDQRTFVESISRGFCQVPSSLFLNLSCFTSKDENSSWQLLERKRMIQCQHSKSWYISI